MEGIEKKSTTTAKRDKFNIDTYAPEQIAKGPLEVKEGTKVYLGPIIRIKNLSNIKLLSEIKESRGIGHLIGSKDKGLPLRYKEGIPPEYRDIFQKLRHLEYIYTNYPEGRVKIIPDVKTGGKTAEILRGEMKKISYSGNMLVNAGKMIDEMETSKEEKKITLVEVSSRSLDFDFDPRKMNTITNFQRVLERAKELGLELCQAEDGPNYMLQLANLDPRLTNGMEDLIVGMEPMEIKGGRKYNAFRIVDGKGRYDFRSFNSNIGLTTDLVPPNLSLYPDLRFIFRLPN